jgi:hypothetical protein
MEQLARAQIDWRGLAGPPTVAERYTVLRRLRGLSQRHQVTVHAFGLSSRWLRLLLDRDGAEPFVDTVRRSVAVWQPGRRECPLQADVVDEEQSLRWVHEVVTLDGRSVARSPWTSEVDLAGGRRASFFDVARARQRLGRSRPVTSHRTEPPADLPRLARLAAAAHGLLPSEPGWEATFVQLATRVGTPTRELAQALRVGPRRVQQLRRARATHTNAARALVRMRVAVP